MSSNALQDYLETAYTNFDVDFDDDDESDDDESDDDESDDDES